MTLRASSENANQCQLEKIVGLSLADLEKRLVHIFVEEFKRRHGRDMNIMEDLSQIQILRLIAMRPQCPKLTLVSVPFMKTKQSIS